MSVLDKKSKDRSPALFPLEAEKLLVSAYLSLDSFLYRPGSRADSPHEELASLAKELRGFS